MASLIIAFIAGVLTVLAPCILPLLPVILAGSITDSKNRRRPFVIITALSLSVLVFTLLLKGTTALITVSPSFWTYVSATILAAFALTLLFPETWAKLVLKIPGHNKPDAWLSRGYTGSSSVWSDILIGAALGPVFTTCSPTFFVILATILPQSFFIGLIHLILYVLGLALILLLVALIGQKFVDKLDWATNPYGWFKKSLGVLFLLLAVFIATGYDKKLQTKILDAGFFDVTKVEQSIREYFEKSPVGTIDINNIISTSTVTQVDTISGRVPDKTTKSSVAVNTSRGTLVTPKQDPILATPTPNTPKLVSQGKYTEIVNPAGFVNSEPFKLADLVGKKVILLDFVTYSCINCQRTFPFMKSWYSNYKDQGFEIVAIHTPEFAFEGVKANVEKAAAEFGLTFPLVLDNEYATWNAYRNRYWPHKYLIDIHGNIVYDHIGEGAYDETENAIVALLNERKKVLGESGTVVKGQSAPAPTKVEANSPETYFGAWRNNNFGNGTPGKTGTATYSITNTLRANMFYLSGDWMIDDKYIQVTGNSSSVSYKFNASNMYIVAESADGTAIEATVMVDGKAISADLAGADVKDGKVTIKDSKLYNIFKDRSGASSHTIEIIFSKKGVRAFTFTFG